MDEVCRVCSVCGLPTYLSVDRCPYCGEKYMNPYCGEKYMNRRELTDRNLTNCCTVNELRKLYGFKDI